MSPRVNLSAHREKNPIQKLLSNTNLEDFNDDV